MSAFSYTKEKMIKAYPKTNVKWSSLKISVFLFLISNISYAKVKERKRKLATLSSKIFVGSTANSKGNPTKNEIWSGFLKNLIVLGSFTVFVHKFSNKKRV